MTPDKATIALRSHARDVLRRARAVPIGSSDRTDLRQLAIGLRWLERKGSQTAQDRVADCLDSGSDRPQIIRKVTGSEVGRMLKNPTIPSE